MARREIQRVVKIGNACGVVIPRDILRALKMERGDLVAMYCVDPNEIIIRRVSAEDVRLARPVVIT